MGLKKWKAVIVCLLSIMLLTGCWDRRELNELALALAIGVDKHEKEYIFTAQVVNPSMVAGQGGGFTRTPIMSYTAKGASLFEAWRKLTKTAPRKLYFSHVKIVVIGEELAREGIIELLDPILRDHEFRTDYYLLIGNGEKAQDVLSMLTSLEEIPAFKIDKMIQAASENLGAGVHETLDVLVNDLKTTGKEPVIPSVKISGDTESGQRLSNLENTHLNTRIKMSGVAVIKDGRLLDYLGDEDTRAYNYTQGQVKSAVEKLACTGQEDKILVAEILMSKSKIKAKIKNGRPEATINVKLEANIADVECQARPQKLPELEKYQEQLGEHIKAMIERVIAVSQQELKTDIIGIGEVVHRYEPKYWKKHEEEWPEIFPDAVVKVKVDAKLRNIGSINQPLQMKEE